MTAGRIRKLPWRVPGAVLAAIAAGVGLGMGVGVALAPTPPPGQLAAAGPIGQVPVTTQSDFVDRRTVDLLVDQGPSQSVYSPLSGRITKLNCAVGRGLSSGDSMFSVDGRAVVLIASSTPMWRNLPLGARGADVRALQRALKVEVTGTLDRATVMAANKFLLAAGAPRLAGESIPASAFAWLPGGGSRASECPVSVGQDVSAGAPVIGVMPDVVGARVREMPDDLTPGARVVLVGGARLPVDADGAVSDRRALAEIGSSKLLRDRPEDSSAVAVPLELAKGLEVTAVPAAALGQSATGSYCVTTSGSAHRVELVGSSLGRALVTTRAPLTGVDVPADPDVPCG